MAGKGDLGGTMRLGAYPAVLAPGLAGRRGVRRDRGLRAAPPPVRGEQRLPRRSWPRPACGSRGTSPDGRLVEFVELDRELHPFFVATQAHPELKSRPTRPHPLFAAFVRRGDRLHAADRLPVGPDRERSQRRELPTRPSTAPPSVSAARCSRSSPTRCDARRRRRPTATTWCTSARSAVVALDDAGPGGAGPPVPPPGAPARCGSCRPGWWTSRARTAVGAAARELAEEADLRAARWDLLVDVHTSPGCSNEKIRLFLARDLTPVPEAPPHPRTTRRRSWRSDGSTWTRRWRWCCAGRSPTRAAVAGLLAAASARDGGWATLRPADSAAPV